jgi:hypothetical protein
MLFNREDWYPYALCSHGGWGWGGGEHKRAKKKTFPFGPRIATWTSTRDTNYRVFLRERGDGEGKIWSGVVTHGVQIVYVLWLRTSCNCYGTVLFYIELYQQTVRPCRIVDVHDTYRKNATLFLRLHTFQNPWIVILTLWIFAPETGPRGFWNWSASVGEKNVFSCKKHYACLLLHSSQNPDFFLNTEPFILSL